MKATAHHEQLARSPKRTWWWLVVGLAVVVGLGVGRALGGDEDAKPRARVFETARARVVAAHAERDEAPREGSEPTERDESHEVSPEGPVVQAAAAVTAPVVASRGALVGVEADAPHEPGMVPHPLDAAHARIHAENRLTQGLNDAMSFRQVAAMRALLAEYRILDPADTDASQAGYAAIADCIEFPGSASLTAAREFYDTARHSPLRRFVRRICFENTN